MRDTAPDAPPARIVLFCELMAMHATAKYEAIIAGLLRAKGYRTIVLLEKADRPIEQLFGASVPDVEFVYLSDAITHERQKAADRKADEIISGLQNLQDLLELEIDGFRIGRNVLSIVLRQFRLGSLANDDAKQRAAVIETLGRSLAVKEFAQRFMAERRPDIAIFNERGYTPPGEVFDACTLSGVDTIQWCGAPQADRLLYRRYRSDDRDEHPLTFSDETWRELQRMPWSDDDDRAVTDRIGAAYTSGAWCSKQQLQDGKEIVDGDHVRRTIGLDPAKKTAVVFSHIFYDATFFYGKNLFDDYERWLVETVRCAVENPELNWIVKVHPANVWRSRLDGEETAQLEAASLAKHLGALPKHVKLMAADTNISTFSLFNIADYGVTVRGTIGLELPCFGIPVVTAGTGRYAGRGFTIDPATRDEYRSVLARLHRIPRLKDEAIRLARLHYFSTFELMPIPMHSVVFNFFAKPINGGVFVPDVNLKQPADLRLLRSQDVGRVVHWMTETNITELLSRDIGSRQAR